MKDTRVDFPTTASLDELATVLPVQVGMWEWDLRDQRVWWSESLRRMLGISGLAAVDVSFDAFVDFVHPDDRDRVQREALVGAEAGHDFETAFRIVRPDGEERWLTSFARVIRDDDDVPIRIHGVDVDQTELFHAYGDRERLLDERALERALFEAVLDQLPIGAVVAEAPSGAVRFNNAALNRLLGRPATTPPNTEAYRSTPATHLDGAPVQPEEWPLAKALQGVSVTDQLLQVPSDTGQKLTVEISAAPVRDADGRIVAAVATVEDVTERLRQSDDRDALLAALEWERAAVMAERALSEAVLRHLPVGIMIAAGPGGQLRSVNEAYKRIMRAPVENPPTMDDYLALELRHPNGAAYALEDRPLSLAMRGEVVEDAEVVVTGFDGAEVQLLINATPAWDQRGQIVAAVAILQDVTDHLRTEREEQRLLRELEAERARLATIIEQLPTGVIVASAPSGRTILSNPRVAEILRYPAVLTETTDDYAAYTAIHPDGTPYRAEEYPLVRALRHGEVVRDEDVHFQRGDQSLGVMSVTAAPVRDHLGRTIAGVVTFTDVTDRYRAERATQLLADAGERLASSLDVDETLQALTELVVPAVADVAYVTLFESAESFKHVAIAGRTPEQASMLRNILHQLDAKAPIDSGFYAVYRTGQPHLVATVPNDNPNIERVTVDEQVRERIRAFNVRANLSVPLSARGQLIGALSFGTVGDCGLDERDMELAVELGRRAALALDNARLHSQAQQAIRERDQLLMTVSHDLKNPLAALAGRVQLLDRVVTGITDDEIRDRVARGLSALRTTAERMTGMIGELQDVSLLREGRALSLVVRQLNIIEVVEQVLEDARQAVPEYEIVAELPRDPVETLADDTRLIQALANLLENATKYSTPETPITVTLAVIPAALPVDVASRAGGRKDESDTSDNAVLGAWIVISVTDQGIGIPVDDLPHIFAQYHRASNVGATSGSGIGLAGARQIVRQHEGDITVESAEGVGSTFTVWLPVET